MYAHLAPVTFEHAAVLWINYDHLCYVLCLAC